MSKTLQQWLSYPETIPTKYTGDGLANMRKVASNCNLLDSLKNKYIVTAGGTNGKGSCVTFLETILLAANYKVGIYTSPHLLKYNERIRLNGINIDDDTLCTAFNEIEKARDSVPLTYFEIATLAAFWIFNQFPLDILILEVGLGGKFDAVNIVDPDIAIITTISLDHVQQLGDNREDIGREKAGIMRANKSIICGDFDPPQSIYQTAKELNAHLYCINQEFRYTTRGNIWDWEWEHENKKLTALPLPQLPLQNAATTLMAIALMQQQFAIPIQAINVGLQNASLAGRFQIMQFHGLQVILDVAHNQASANLLAQNLSQQTCGGQTLVVSSMLKDKDIAMTFKELKGIADKWHIGTLQTPRAASQTQLQKNVEIINLKEVFYYGDIIDAFKAAVSSCKKDDRIVVFGSFYTVAEVLKFMQNAKQLT